MTDTVHHQQQVTLSFSNKSRKVLYYVLMNLAGPVISDNLLTTYGVPFSCWHRSWLSVCLSSSLLMLSQVPCYQLMASDHFTYILGWWCLY